MNVNDLLDRRMVTHSSGEATSNLRLLKHNDGTQTLQQMFLITDYNFDRPAGIRHEWRDVPVFEEQ